MKKAIRMLLAGVLMIAGLTACSGNTGVTTEAVTGTEDTSVSSENGVEVVTTIYPIYDWTKQIVGDNGNVDTTVLIDNGVDLHSYQPSAQDILKISTCDLFIYVGGESDAWVDDALQEAVNKDMIVINLMDVLGDGAQIEEMVEGMQESEHHHDHEEGEEEHDHEEGEEEHDHEEGEEEHDHEHEAEYDEHVWLSLKNASLFTQKIADALVSIDAENAESYKTNAENYKKELDALDAEYAAAVKDAKRDTLLFGDRFPFRYLVEDYDLNYYAAFIGCSAETEASFETVTFLANKVDELDLQYVLIIEGSDGKIADTIVSNTKDKDQEVLVLNSIQSVVPEDAKTGSYLDIMKDNLEVLRKALQ